MTLVLAIFTANAYDPYENPAYAYVKTDGVNLRTKPNTTSRVYGKAGVGEIHLITNFIGDWYELDYDLGIESTTVYIKKDFVDVLHGTSAIDNPAAKSFLLDDGDLVGFLTFEKTSDENMLNYNYMLKSRSMQAAGGSGTVDVGNGIAMYFNGNLMQPESHADAPLVYDPTSGKLSFAGYLWTEDK